MSKGSNRRPEKISGSYRRNWTKIFRKQCKCNGNGNCKSCGAGKCQNH